MNTDVLRSLAVSGLLLALGGILRAQESAVSVTYPHDLRDAVSTIEKVERFTEGQGQFDWLRIPEALASVRKDAEDYLSSHPDDLGGLLLLARVGRLAALFAPHTLRTEDGGWVGDTADHLAPVHATLDRLLELEPRLAEGYYLKARLLATSNPRFQDDSLVMIVDWDGCLSNAERASRLAPEETRYRELLALARAETGDLEGAADAVRDVDRGRNLVYLLLNDFAVFPMPEKRVPLPGVQATFAEMFGQSGLGGYVPLRVRAFAITGTVDGLEEFYSSTWPNFKLFKQRGSDESRTFGQFLSVTRSGFKPATSDKALTSNNHPGDGVMMIVMELSSVPEGANAEYPDEPWTHSPFVQVVLINYRRK